MVFVQLNIDAGESPAEPRDLFQLAHLVSIACGGHAGDDASMDRALTLCGLFGTRAGAHPSYADREGFGRRPLAESAETVARSVAEQVAALAARARIAGVPLLHVKPHGALYHAANQDDALAEAVVEGALLSISHFTLIGPAGGALARAAHVHTLPFAREGFADRGVRIDGSLIPRGEAGALLDPAAAATRTRELVRSGAFETVCVHADTPDALAVALAVRQELDAVPR